MWLSDHNTAQIVSFPVKNKDILPKKTYSYKRCYSDEYINKFKCYLSQISFSETLGNPDLNAAFNDFHELFLTIYNSCFPILKITIKQSQKQTNWITKGLKKSCNKKRVYRYKYYKSKTIFEKLSTLNIINY